MDGTTGLNGLRLAGRGSRMASDFTLTVTDEKRRKIFTSVFGSDTVQIQSPIAEEALLREEFQRFYLLDVAALSDEQYHALIEHLVNEFGGEVEDAERFLKEQALPIIAHDTVVTIEHPQKWLD